MLKQRVDTCQLRVMLNLRHDYLGYKKTYTNKEIEKVIQYAESHGWRFKDPGGSSHAWGRLLCPNTTRDGCSMSIWSTPKSPENYAKQIKRNIDNCPHLEK